MHTKPGTIVLTIILVAIGSGCAGDADSPGSRLEDGGRDAAARGDSGAQRDGGVDPGADGGGRDAGRSGGGDCALPRYPDETCTGVPAGTELSAYTGPHTITEDGTVIDGRMIEGGIAIEASGVVIRNSLIHGSVYVDDYGQFGVAEPVLIQDSTIDCQNAQGSTGVGEAHFSLLRVEIVHCENGLDVNQDVTVRDSYIHDLGHAGPDPHADGIQLSFGHSEGVAGVYPCCARDVTIEHNTIFGMSQNDTVFETSAIISNPSGDENILIQHNLLAGGAYTLYCDRPGTGTNYQVIENAFTTRFSDSVGYFGKSDDCNDEIISGNFYYETGEPIDFADDG